MTNWTLQNEKINKLYKLLINSFRMKPLNTFEQLKKIKKNKKLQGWGPSELSDPPWSSFELIGEKIKVLKTNLTQSTSWILIISDKRSDAADDSCENMESNWSWTREGKIKRFFTVFET